MFHSVCHVQIVGMTLLGEFEVAPRGYDVVLVYNPDPRKCRVHHSE
jgi:hypothetical protein